MEQVRIEEAATRPPMAPWIGLPLKLAGALICLGAVFFVLIDTLKWQAITVGSIAIIAGAIRPLVARDYHGFDIFLIWLRNDATSLDRDKWGGTQRTPMPLRIGHYGMTI
jgi:type IV secretory pathway VirB3-like protein